MVAAVEARLALRVTMPHTADAAFGHSIGTRAHFHCTAATQTRDTRNLALCVCEALGGSVCPMNSRTYTLVVLFVNDVAFVTRVALFATFLGTIRAGRWIAILACTFLFCEVEWCVHHGHNALGVSVGDKFTK